MLKDPHRPKFYIDRFLSKIWRYLPWVRTLQISIPRARDESFLSTHAAASACSALCWVLSFMLRCYQKRPREIHQKLNKSTCYILWSFGFWKIDLFDPFGVSKVKFPCCQPLKGPINPKISLDNSKNRAKTTKVYNKYSFLGKRLKMYS